MRWLNVALTALIFILPAQARAADSVFSPGDCEFQVTFPEAPGSAEICNPENPKDCTTVGTFNRVYGIDSALRFKVTCNKAEENMMQRYSADVMQYTLEALGKSRTDEAQTGFNDHTIAKQAILLGSKKDEAGHESVYMAQLWIGKNSVLTIEGEVTGVENPEADQLMARIMGSVRPDSWPDPAEQPAEKAEEKPETDPAPQKTE